jgi:integrase
LTQAVAFFGETRRLESITHEDVAAYRAKLAELGVNGNTAALYLTRFGALYSFLNKQEAKRARQMKRVPASIFCPLDREEHVPQTMQTRVRFLLEPEARLLMTATPPSYEIAIALGLFAGLRIGEVLMLRPGLDLSLERGVIYVQAREGWQPKHGKNREVPISDALRPYCERHLATLPLTAPYVLPGWRREVPMGAQALHTIVRRVVTDAGLEPGRVHAEGVTFHTLRHTFASWLVMAGADLLTISKLMGHAGIGQVVETYGHLSPGHLRTTVEMLTTKWFAAPAEVPV